MQTINLYKQRTNIEYLVTNGCYMQNVYQRYLEEGCRERMPDDIFSVHPVLDIKTNISYLNMYCYLCNMPRFNFIPSSSKPWDIEIYCSVFIDFKSFLTMANLLDTIKRSRCNVTYLPLEKSDLPHNVAYCLKTDTMYNGICNSSGKWFVYDDHVRYACEKIAFGALSEFYRLRLKPRCEHPYKNVYCALCNPEHTENITIKDCNVTGDAPAFDELTLTACNFFPEVNVYPPYKNLFCRDCNIGKQGAACAGQSKFLPEVFWTDPLQWLPIYRNLFSCTELKKTLSLRKHSICNSAQIYDSLSDQCRNITCYPGKFYINGKCLALFPETKNLGYILIASFKGNVSSIFPVKKLLQTIHHTVKNNTIHDLMIQHTDPLEEVIIQIDQPCLTKEQSLSFLNFTGSIALKMFIKSRKSYGYDSFDIFPNGSARVCITDFETKESFIVKEEKNERFTDKKHDLWVKYRKTQNRIQKNVPRLPSCKFNVKGKDYEE
ncbi:uncharacterized protein LOC134251148 [Saccostrea cucullata]|uniref:uncharacterized protein LOC134251148 n=1 Tax=Saccostrea cuccullata TaxID=36930 RepID=UPI002ED13304